MQLIEAMMKGPPPDSEAGAPEAAASADPEAGAAPAASRVRAPRNIAIVAATACFGLLCAFVATINPNGRAAQVPVEPLTSRVTRAIQTAGVLGVTVRAGRNGAVSVEGMVVDGGEAARLRNALVPFAADHVAQRYAAAADVAQSIADALSNPGLSVRYQADGVFTVTGASVDLEGVRAKLRHIATDLAPSVARIELNATELPPPARLPTNALMSSSDVQYVQTRDGTKHLMIRTPIEGVEVPK
jgi:type III secretion protein D